MDKFGIYHHMQRWLTWSRMSSKTHMGQSSGLHLKLKYTKQKKPFKSHLNWKADFGGWRIALHRRFTVVHHPLKYMHSWPKNEPSIGMTRIFTEICTRKLVLKSLHVHCNRWISGFWIRCLPRYVQIFCYKELIVSCKVYFLCMIFRGLRYYLPRLRDRPWQLEI